MRASTGVFAKLTCGPPEVKVEGDAWRSFTTRRSLSDLAHHTLLHTILDADADVHTLASQDQATWPLRDGGDVSVTPRILSNDNEFIQGCVADGMGISILPDYTAEGLVPLLPRLVGNATTVWAVTTHAGAHLPRVRAGIEVAAQLFADGAV